MGENLHLLRVFYSRPYRGLVVPSSDEIDRLSYFVSGIKNLPVTFTNVQHHDVEPVYLNDFRFMQNGTPDLVIFAPGWGYDAACRFDMEVSRELSIPSLVLPIDWKEVKFDVRREVKGAYTGKHLVSEHDICREEDAADVQGTSEPEDVLRVEDE